MKFLQQLLREMDELSCLECGGDLRMKGEFETGLCSKCSDEEECEYMECWVDKDDNILTEAAVRMFKRMGKEIKRKYRCTTGPKKGKPVSDPSKCAQRKDPKKVRHGRKVARAKKGVRIRKSIIARRTSMSKMVTRMNARLKGTKASLPVQNKNTKSASIPKPKQIKGLGSASKPGAKPKKADKPKKATKPKKTK